MTFLFYLLYDMSIENSKSCSFFKKIDDSEAKKLQKSNIVYKNLTGTNTDEIRHNKLKYIKYFDILKIHCNKKEVTDG